MVNSWVKTHLTLPKILAGISILCGVLGTAFLLYEWIGYLIDAYSHALNFSGYPTNGAFQLFNPLLRMSQGQTPGVDFQIFHGLGVILLHYPLFVLFGETLFASEMARFILSPSLFMLVVFTFIWVTTRKWYFATTGTAIMVLMYYWHYLSTIQPLNSSLGVRSAMPIILASLFIWLFSSPKTQWIFKSRFPWFELLSAVLLGLTLLMGTEHGFASLLAFLFVYVLFARHHTFWKRILGACYVVGFYLASVVIIYLSISGSHFLEPLKYAFLEVPADQFWYFGAPPNKYLTTIFDLFANPFIEGNILVGLGFLLATIGLHFTKKVSYTFGILFILVYGLISNISLLGYYEPYYTEPLSRVNILVLIWIGCTALPLILKTYVPAIKKTSWLPAIVFGQIPFLIAAGVMFVKHLDDIPYITPKMDILTITDQRDKTKHSGVYLSDSWAGVESKVMEVTGLNAFRTNSFPLTDKNWNNGIDRTWTGFFMGSSQNLEDKLTVGQTLYFNQGGQRTIYRIDKNGMWWNVYVDGAPLDPIGDGYPNAIYIESPRSEQTLPTVWSTYSGIVEVDNGIEQASGYDYIIHAVGKNRRAEYIESFDETQPDFVVTIRYDFFVYEEWLRNEHWGFYQRLIQNYEIKDKSDYYLIWQKKANHAWTTDYTDGWKKIPVNSEQTNVLLPVEVGHQDIQVLLVKVNYQISNPIKFLPYLGSLPRYLITPINAASHTGVSLAPYETTWQFPVIVYPGQDLPELVFHTDSIIPGPTFTVTDIEYQQIPLDERTTRLFVGAPLE